MHEIKAKLNPKYTKKIWDLADFVIVKGQAWMEKSECM